MDATSKGDAHRLGNVFHLYCLMKTMNILHPLENIPRSSQKLWFVLLLIITLLVMIVLNIIGIPLKTEVAPQGIVSFELAGDLPTAQTIMNSWDQKARIHAGLSLGFDYLFMVLYSTTITLACVMVARHLRLQWQVFALIGLALAWGQWLAAILDGVENYALFLLLVGSDDSLWPAVAWWCATVKFFIVILGILYSLVGTSIRFLKR